MPSSEWHVYFMKSCCKLLSDKASLRLTKRGQVSTCREFYLWLCVKNERHIHSFSSEQEKMKEPKSFPQYPKPVETFGSLANPVYLWPHAPGPVCDLHMVCLLRFCLLTLLDMEHSQALHSRDSIARHVLTSPMVPGDVLVCKRKES